jgi:hypothetical protein
MAGSQEAIAGLQEAIAGLQDCRIAEKDCRIAGLQNYRKDRTMPFPFLVLFLSAILQSCNPAIRPSFLGKHFLGPPGGAPQNDAALR